MEVTTFGSLHLGLGKTVFGLWGHMVEITYTFIFYLCIYLGIVLKEWRHDKRKT